MENQLQWNSLALNSLKTTNFILITKDILYTLKTIIYYILIFTSSSV